MNAFFHHFSFEFRTGIRNTQLLFLNYLFPLGFFLIMGSIMPAVNPPFRESLIPAMVVFALLAGTLLGLPDPLVNARENGIFRSYKINGVPASSILIIPALTTILHLLVVAAIITLTASLLFDAPTPTDWLGYLLTILATAIACAGISLLIGVVSVSTRMTVLWSQLIFIPSMMLGGLMIPYSYLAESVAIAAKLSRLLPATLAMNAFRGLAMGQGADFSAWGSVVVLALSGVLALGLAIYLFNWDRHNTTQRGHPVLALFALLPYIVGIFVL
jgi:ABC-2 type transport system permease protein